MKIRPISRNITKEEQEEDFHIEPKPVDSKITFIDRIPQTILYTIYERGNGRSEKQPYLRTVRDYVRNKLEDGRWLESILDADNTKLRQLPYEKIAIRCIYRNLSLEFVDNEELIKALFIVEGFGNSNVQETDYYFNCVRDADTSTIINVLLALNINKDVIPVLDFFVTKQLLVSSQNIKDIQVFHNDILNRYRQLDKLSSELKQILYGTNDSRIISNSYPKQLAIEIYATMPIDMFKKKLGVIDTYNNYSRMKNKSNINITDYINVADSIYHKKKEDRWNYISDRRLEKITNVKMILLRSNQLRWLEELKTRKSFYLPYNASKGENYNNGSILGDSFDDKNQIVLAYGTLYKFNCYTVSELTATFNNYKVAYFLPDDPKSVFSEQDISDLLYIVNTCVDIKDSDLNALTKSIKLIKDYPAEKMVDYLKSKKEMAKDIKLFFKTMFEYAMYLRRWKGSHHPYPLDSKDTHNRGRKYESKAAITRLEMINIIDKDGNNKMILDLKLMRKNDEGAPIIYTSFNNIGHLLRQIDLGVECMRMASEPLCCTSIYYLDKICGLRVRDHEGRIIEYGSIGRIS